MPCEYMPLESGTASPNPLQRGYSTAFRRVRDRGCDWIWGYDRDCAPAVRSPAKAGAARTRTKGSIIQIFMAASCLEKAFRQSARPVLGTLPGQ